MSSKFCATVSILLTLADIMNVKSMQYCLHLSRNVNNNALENVDVMTYILHPFAMCDGY